MKRLFSEITITSATTKAVTKFDFVAEIGITSTWKEFTDKATITIPKKITKGGQSIVNGSNAIFKKGDIVQIKIGYYPTLTTVFDGYIARVEIDAPVVLHCEDEMFKLKLNTITKSYKTINLKELVKDISGTTKTDVVDAELGQFRITNATPCQVLEELKSTYMLDAFIKNKTLHVGLRYIPELSKKHKLLFEKHIIEHSLEWQNIDDVKINMKMISMLPNNKKIEIEVGDVGGETRTAYFYGLTEKEMRKIALDEIKKFKYTGFRGGFTTFGEPVMNHGDVVELTSLKFPERNGEYFIDAVERKFGQSGSRQIVEIGLKSIVGNGFGETSLK